MDSPAGGVQRGRGGSVAEARPAARPARQLRVHTDLKDQRGRYPNHEFLIPGEGPFDYVRYFELMDQTGYRGHVTVEISLMVQRRPGYDPAMAAAMSHKTLTSAARQAGVALAHR